uniref:DNA/RNA polymerases superfamily protein n=1 Tax=Tanacetum cinerariifolium TaxID=118510 RepID=A0A6L2J750_TANCI|nr:DNA/RNA polymerases superfamily protein [Tanacetum cinerariifolium]
MSVRFTITHVRRNVVADALSRRERVKPKRVLAMAMTIQSGVKRMILAAQSEAFKEEKSTAEMLRGLDERMEKRKMEVIVDRLTKSAYFLAIREDYKIKKLARLYINKIVVRHGAPVSIISDRDERFTSRFWQTLQEALGLRFRYDWDVHLPLAEFSYNNSYHSSIRCALFEALYKRMCRSPVLWDEIRESRLIGSKLVQETTDKVVLIKENLKAARDRQKSYADNRRKLLEFEIEDQVLLKVSPWKEPIEIIDCEVNSLKRSRIPRVKVHRNLKRGHKDFINLMFWNGSNGYAYPVLEWIEWVRLPSIRRIGWVRLPSVGRDRMVGEDSPVEEDSTPKKKSYKDVKIGRLKMTIKVPCAFHGPLKKRLHCAKVKFLYPKIASLEMGIASKRHLNRAEYGVPFTLLHAWSVLKYCQKWKEEELLRFG